VSELEYEYTCRLHCRRCRRWNLLLGFAIVDAGQPPVTRAEVRDVVSGYTCDRCGGPLRPRRIEIRGVVGDT